MAEAGELVALVEKRLEEVGVSIADGFDILDIPVIVESVIDVLHTSSSTWKESPKDEKIRIIRDIVLEIDRKHAIIDRGAAAFVAWDIPYVPDGAVDSFLTNERVAGFLRLGLEMIVEKLLDRFITRQMRTSSSI